MHCSFCKILDFDDSLGYSSGLDGESGPVYLKFDRDDRERDFELHDSDNPMQDVFPDLLVLQKSGEAGCEFCALLRSTLLRRDVATEMFTSDTTSQPAKEAVSISCIIPWRLSRVHGHKGAALLRIIARVQVTGKL